MVLPLRLVKGHPEAELTEKADDKCNNNDESYDCHRMIMVVMGMVIVMVMVMDMVMD